MATYKSEFLSHYYEGRLRPRAAYAMGLIMIWSRFAALAPWLANGVVAIPGLNRFAKFVAGVHPARELPKFASATFRKKFLRRQGGKAAGRRVILWADTLNNYFRPEVSEATVRVLEAAGFAVSLPRKQYCCGRPLYDFGFVDKAKRMLAEAMHGLKEEIAAGTPIIFMEPSCAAVFRDELLNLFPGDETAGRLSRQCFFLSEFLEREAKDFSWPRLSGKAVVQGHCHHRAVLRFKEEESLLRRLGLEVEILESGCCGMAGSFGFDEKHYEVSQAAGERVLFPRIRAGEAGEQIIANGFSCREQIEQGTGHETRHLAEVLAEALDKTT
jgi:Fe-S oxidoreductase